MAFFEQLGKRLVDAGQGVAQQTKNLADVTRLNSSISEKERKVSQLYLAMGQSYYEAHRQDPAAECLQQIEQINQLHEEIAQQQEEIKQIKGVVKCTACGAEIPLHAAFCNVCGAKVVSDEMPRQDSRDLVTCPICGERTSRENTFCRHCGTRLGGERAE